MSDHGEPLHELRAALKATQLREAQLRQVLDLVPEYIFANDRDGIVLLSNDAHAGAYGTDPETLVGANYVELDPDREQAEGLLELDRQVIASGEPARLPELELVDAHGRDLTIDLRLIPYVEARTGKDAVLGVGVDITERRRAERAVEAGKARLEDAIESVADGFVLFDAEDRLVMKNSRMLELAAPEAAGAYRLGIPFDEMVRSLVELDQYHSIDGIGAADREQLVARRIALHRDAPSTHEQRYRHGVCLIVSTRPTAEGGRIVAYTDVTELKRQEAALREKERIERELEIARQIQRALLPDRPPEVPGFRIAGWNEPAAHTGGDYFDWLELPDGRVLVTIADVTGHGVGPAILVSACRAYLRSCSRIENSVELVMAKVDELIAPDLTGGRFVTAAVGLLDPGTGRMHLFSAGHGPILFYRAAERRFVSWPANDVPLGLLSLSGGDARSREIDFEPGDLLVLVTDGFYEWADSDDEPFGIERLTATLETLAEATPEAMIEGLHQAVRSHVAGTQQPDDLTAVMVKREAAA